MLYYLVSLSHSVVFFDRSDFSDLIMASITLPQFKLRWLDEAGKERARSLLYNHMGALQQREVFSSDDGSEDGHIGQEDDFFCFGNSKTDEIGSDTEVDCIQAILPRILAG
jgi:hypothetical protein